MTPSANQLTRRLGEHRFDGWLLPLALAVVAAGLVFFAMGDGRERVLVVSLGGCGFSLATYLALNRLLPRHCMSRLLVVSYALQMLALAMIAALGLRLGLRYHPFDINVGDAPVRSALALMTVPTGALLAAIVWSFVSRLHPPNEATTLEDVARNRRIYLVIAAWMHLLYWPAGLESSGGLGYLGRILASGLMCAPFLAGRDSTNDRRLAMLWSVTIVINTCIGIVAGTRSKAFIAAVLFGAGYISAMPKKKRLRLSALAIVVAVPLIQLAGALGVVRDQLGRGGLEMVESRHISEVFSLLSREMFNKGDDSEVLREHGVSRLLAWTNVVVPLMTPETIPYRGMDGFLDEAVQTFKVSSVSGSTPDDLYDAGLWNAPARQYGFTVNSETSVEFTLAADGWSRGGAPIGILFSFLAALALTTAEVAVSRLHRFGEAASSVLALPLAKAAFFDSNITPLLPILRGLVLYPSIVALVVIAVEAVRHTVRTSSRRNTPIVPQSWRRG